MKNALGLIVFLVVLSVIASGCLIMIGENSFRSLTERDKTFVKPFDAEVLEVKDTASGKYLYEVTASDILEQAKKNEYTWVHFWRSYCSNDHCQNIGTFQETADKHDSLTLIMVSVTYDFGSIRRITKVSDFTHPILVLKDGTYGHKLTKGRELLATDFNLEGGGSFGDNLVYKRDSLIYNGDNGQAFLDSIFSRPTLNLSR